MHKKTGEAWLGIDSRHGRYMFGSEEGPADGLVLPRQTVHIITLSHVPFTSERLFVRRACAADFLIHGIYVGARYSGTVNHPGALIAEPFAVDFEALPSLDLSAFDGEKALRVTFKQPFTADQLGGPLPLPTLQPGMHLNFTIENIGGAPQRFLGALLGQGHWS